VFPAPASPAKVMKRPRTAAPLRASPKKPRPPAPADVASNGSELFYRLRIFRATEPALLRGSGDRVQAETGRSKVLRGRGSIRTLPEVRRENRPPPRRPPPGVLLRLLGSLRVGSRNRLGRPESPGELPSLFPALPRPF